MKIGPFANSSARSVTTGERPAARPTSAAKSSDPTSGSTQVALSESAASLLDVADTSFDAEKVERIAQAIRDGSFRINAGAIADKLLDNAQELLVRSQH
ncbi:flagellar biosynthesis anti-sigma factor FlgM [Azohydromonas caseinilytica]|uniref:Negative regulator of flagellin synthesis n=1 Tax=Azohydromonas caseinilytica TaxID=2728836 RepID=A0A848FA88_9BURK|nr:flagellar biosynthesis anti-sigma factor FlgM [Azohydromonas caseinilytica]NML14901.1 flagellar biosynthesis anti-sigma factor FlgM [Azohydromonas caseinilytica]